MTSAITVDGLSKTYTDGFQALKNVSLDIRKGEIFALLGPNGAGKTTMIGSICGLVNPSAGSIRVFSHDIRKNYRQARNHIGLVPQELTTDAFETVWHTVNFSRGVFGKPKDHTYIENILKKLSLWDKKDQQLRRLSGGMKRRVMIAKALSHEPDILFLDEPSAGVDVELRKSMWAQVQALRETGVTIILTTHYIEEAEEIADRIGVINKGELIIVEEKNTLMKKLGTKELALDLEEPLKNIPNSLSGFNLVLSENKQSLIFTYDTSTQNNGVSSFLDQLKASKIKCRDLHTRQSSLEDIFVQLVGQ